MSRDFNNWSRPRRPRGRNWGSQNDRPRHPPGLRGVEIGMYYRGLQKKKAKKEMVVNINLDIKFIVQF